MTSGLSRIASNWLRSDAFSVTVPGLAESWSTSDACTVLLSSGQQLLPVCVVCVCVCVRVC
jgi:hypothetical protein